MQLIGKISDTLRFWATLWGLRHDVRCSSSAHWKARCGLPISVNWTFSLGVTAEELRVKIDRNRQFRSTPSVWPKISGKRRRPLPIIFALIVRLMNALQLCRWPLQTKKLWSRLSSSEVRFYTESAFCVLSPLWRVGATYDDHFRLIGKREVDFLLVLIWLLSLGVMAEAQRANIG